MASLRLLALLALAATATGVVRGGYSFVRPDCDSELCGFESDKRDGAPTSVEETSSFEPRRPWSLSVAARSLFEDGGLPLCACRVQRKVVDLGARHFPRYLTATECRDSNCWPPPYGCREIKYKIAVLKQREEGEVPDRHAPLLPESLREAFAFEPVQLSVGCECSA